MQKQIGKELGLEDESFADVIQEIRRLKRIEKKRPNA
jgi:hypothetical protein